MKHIAEKTTAISLFMNEIGGKDVEAVHQKILVYLFRSKTFLDFFFGDKINCQEPEILFETHKRLFDIEVRDKKSNTTKAFIELKTWSPVRQNQKENQKEKAETLGVPLFYFLLGISMYEHQDLNQRKIDLNEVAGRYLAEGPDIGIIAEELDFSEEATVDLLDAYFTGCQNIHKWLHDEAWQWKNNRYNIPHQASKLIALKKTQEAKNPMDAPPIVQTCFFRSGSSDVALEVYDKTTDRNHRILAGFKGFLFPKVLKDRIHVYFKTDDDYPVDKKDPSYRKLQEEAQQLFKDDRLDANYKFRSSKLKHFVPILYVPIEVDLKEARSLNEYIKRADEILEKVFVCIRND